MEDSSRTHQRVQHSVDRRVRELYRYYQPAEWPSNASSWPSNTTTGIPDPPPAADGANSPSGSATSRPSSVGPETLVLGASNNTMTSFAQLAALRLNVERALICVLDRDTQYIIAEATKSVSLDNNDSTNAKDETWLGTQSNRRAWSLCEVSVLGWVFALLVGNRKFLTISTGHSCHVYL